MYLSVLIICKQLDQVEFLPQISKSIIISFILIVQSAMKFCSVLEYLHEYWISLTQLWPFEDFILSDHISWISGMPQRLK